MAHAHAFKRALVLVLLAATGLELLLTFAGYVGSQRYLEVTSDYRPYQLIMGVVCLTLALSVRRSRIWPKAASVLLISSAVIAGVNALEVMPVLLAPKAASRSVLAVTGLKAVAFNVEASNIRFTETREWIVSESPDVAMFCEAHGQWKGELLPLTNTFPHHVRIDAMDIEVFSRHSIVETQVFNFGPERGFVVINLSVNNAILTFVAVHAYPRHWYGDEGFRQRTSTLVQGLGEDLRPFARPLLVMGDLNASPWSPAYKTMVRKSGLRSARQGFGLAATHSGHGTISRWLWRPLDHCLHSPDICIERFWTGPDLGSDHRPILVECSLPGARRP